MKVFAILESVLVESRARLRTYMDCFIADSLASFTFITQTTCYRMTEILTVLLNEGVLNSEFPVHGTQESH